MSNDKFLTAVELIQPQADQQVSAEQYVAAEPTIERIVDRVVVTGTDRLRHRHEELLDFFAAKAEMLGADAVIEAKLQVNGVEYPLESLSQLQEIEVRLPDGRRDRRIDYRTKLQGVAVRSAGDPEQIPGARVTR